MRLIDADKIVIPKGFFKDMNTPKLLNWLNSQPTINQWISVEERLPDESGDYLTLHKNDAVTWCSVSHYSARHQKFNAYDELPDARYASETVTHWMPLPESPKEE